MRLIDADRLKSYIDCGHLRPPTEVCFSELDVCNMIDKAPTVSAEGGDADMTVIPEGTGLMQPSPNNGADLISREDALTALNGSCSTWQDDSKFADIIKGLPSAKVTGDLISRADAIEAVVAWTVEDRPTEEMPTDLVDRLNALPSAEAEQVTGKLIDGLEMLRFFNQRAGRELWQTKPREIQNTDIKDADEILSKAISALSAEAVKGWIPLVHDGTEECKRDSYHKESEVEE